MGSYEPMEPLTLDGVIKRHQSQSGDSYDDIAKKTGLSKAKIGQLARGTPWYAPRAETLRKLAVGLGLPQRMVQEAATASGRNESMQPSQRVESLTSYLMDMTVEDLEVIEAIVVALWQLRREKRSG